MTATKKTRKSVSPAIENVTNDDTRIISESSIGIGESYAQGDLMFVRINGMPRGAKMRRNRQLAEGTTQGSRHMCAIGDVFDCDRRDVAKAIKDASGVDVAEQYMGPVVVTKDRAAVIEHPEHGNHEYEGDMVLACVFQRSLDAEEREQRVLD